MAHMVLATGKRHIVLMKITIFKSCFVLSSCRQEKKIKIMNCPYDGARKLNLNFFHSPSSKVRLELLLWNVDVPGDI